MEQLTIKSLSFGNHPFSPGRQVLVGLSNGRTYTVSDLQGDYCFGSVSLNKYMAAHLEANPEVQRLLTAVGEFYRYWLNGHEDPMEKLLAKDSPVIHELYEDEVDHDGSGPALGEVLATEPDYLAELLVAAQRALSLNAINDPGNDWVIIRSSEGRELVELLVLSQSDFNPDAASWPIGDAYELRALRNERYDLRRVPKSPEETLHDRAEEIYGYVTSVKQDMTKDRMMITNEQAEELFALAEKIRRTSYDRQHGLRTKVFNGYLYDLHVNTFNNRYFLTRIS